MNVHRIRGAGLLVAAAALFALAVSAPARADTVTDWNAIASTAIVSTAGQSPHASTLSFAMVQGAVYDAVNAIDRGHRPYLVAPRDQSVGLQGGGRARRRGSACSRACSRPSSATLQPLYDASLAAVPDGPGKDGGIAAGDAAAAAMLAARANDGRNGPFDFPIGSEPGAWRPTPPTFALDPAPWVGNVRPFLVPSAAMHPLRPPQPAHQRAPTRRTSTRSSSSARWRARPAPPTRPRPRSSGRTTDRRYGTASSGRSRQVAGSTSPTPPACSRAPTWLRPTARSAAGRASTTGTSGGRSPRSARPQTDGNPATEADPAWTPLFDPATPQFGTPLVTPGFPEHPSGHGCISGAIVHTLQDFFGTDKIAFSAFSNRTRTTRELRPLLRRAQGDHRRPRVGRHPLPNRRRTGRRARQEGRPLARQALLPTRRLSHAQRNEGRTRPAPQRPHRQKLSEHRRTPASQTVAPLQV